jgi:hypothetical protein
MNIKKAQKFGLFLSCQEVELNRNLRYSTGDPTHGFSRHCSTAELS